MRLLVAEQTHAFDQVLTAGTERTRRRPTVGKRHQGPGQRRRTGGTRRDPVCEHLHQQPHLGKGRPTRDPAGKRVVQHAERLEREVMPSAEVSAFVGDHRGDLVPSQTHQGARRDDHPAPVAAGQTVGDGQLVVEHHDSLEVPADQLEPLSMAPPTCAQ